MGNKIDSNICFGLNIVAYTFIVYTFFKLSLKSEVKYVPGSLKRNMVVV